MKAILYENKSEAETFSKFEALRRGCTGTTQYWWPVRKTKRLGYAVMVGEDFDVVDENGETIDHPEIAFLDENDFPNEEEMTLTQSLTSGAKKLLGLGG